MHKKEFIVEVNSADDGDILIWSPPKDWLPPIPVKKELIRCKDCRFYDDTKISGYCSVHNNSEMERQDYCSKGERKEEC